MIRQAGLAARGESIATERLSSGLRINGASDDAAGLAIALALRADTKIYTKALQNVTDGISAASISEGALTSLSSINKRMSELAEQSANGVFSSKQRAALDQELQALIEEHNRIISTTTFNGRQLLTADAASLDLQIGADSDRGAVFSLSATGLLSRTVGSGTFSPGASYATGTGPLAVATGDLNGDGRADVVTANGGSANVSVLLSQSDGTLGAATNIALSANPSSLALADLNGDGKLDLVTADNGGAVATVLYGTGTGGFTAGGTISTGSGPLGVAVGDINNDGRADVVTSATSGGSGGTSVQFTSGTAESSSITIPAVGGVAESNQVTFPAVSAGGGAQEVTNIDTVSAGQGVVSTVTLPTIGPATRGSTTVTTVGTGDAEATTIGTIANSKVEQTRIVFGAGSTIMDGDDFTLSSPTTDYYVWFAVDGVGNDPNVGGRTGIRVDISSLDPSVTVAADVASAIDADAAFSAFDAGGGSVLIMPSIQGDTTDAGTGTLSNDSYISLISQGATTGLTVSDYILLTDTSGTTYAFHFGDDSLVPGGTVAVPVSLADGATANDVASTLSSAIAGVNGGNWFSTSVANSTIVVTNKGPGNVSDVADGGTGFAINTTIQGSSTSLEPGDTFILHMQDNDYYVWFTIDGIGTDPAIGGMTGISVALNSSSSAGTVANAIASQLPSSLFSSSAVGSTVTITNRLSGGDGSTSYDGGTGFTVSGGDGTNTPDLQTGDYFLLNGADTNYYVWFNINGLGQDPAIGGRTGIQVNISDGATDTQIRDAVSAALPSSAFALSPIGLASLEIRDRQAGLVSGISDGNVGPSLSYSVTGGIAGNLRNGGYFLISSPTTNYYAWFNINGDGIDPNVPGRTGIEISIPSDTSNGAVATLIATALQNTGSFTTNVVANIVTATNTAAGSSNDASAPTAGTGFGVGTLTQGTDGGAGVTNNSYFMINTPSNAYYVWFDVDGAGVDPVVGGRTGIHVAVNTGDSDTTVAANVSAAVSGAAGDLSTSLSGNQVTFTATTKGSGSVSAGTASDLTIANLQDGAASTIASGDYFLLSSPSTNYYVWYNVAGAGGDPAVAGRTGIQVALGANDDAGTVATKTRDALNGVGPFSANAAGSTLTVTNLTSGASNDGSDGNVGGAFAFSVLTQGTAAAVNPATDRITATAHGFSTGAAVTLTTTGALPGGLSTATTYYAIAVDANTVKLASSPANALAGTAIDITSLGNGTHTITGSGTAPGIRTFLGQSGGTFSSQTAFNLGVNPIDLKLGDINGDGNQDLLVADQGQNALLVRLGAGTGGFGATVSYGTGTTPEALAVADINNDGLADVVTANSGSDTLSVFLGRAGGTLQAQSAISTGGGSAPRGLTLTDVNGDGSPDLVAAYSGTAAAGVFLNNKHGSFTSAGTVASGSGPRAVALGDINGDGAPDLITANEGSNTITVSNGVISSSTELQLFNIRTQANARAALDTLSQVATRISAQLGALGSAASRLQSVQRTLQATRENYQAAEGRISDADVAEESAHLLRSRVLVQVSQAVLAQANAEPRIVLSLLQNLPERS